MYSLSLEQVITKFHRTKLLSYTMHKCLQNLMAFWISHQTEVYLRGEDLLNFHSSNFVIIPKFLTHDLYLNAFLEMEVPYFKWFGCFYASKRGLFSINGTRNRFWKLSWRECKEDMNLMVLASIPSHGWAWNDVQFISWDLALTHTVSSIVLLITVDNSILVATVRNLKVIPEYFLSHTSHNQSNHKL